jgi:hypothetical protein
MHETSDVGPWWVAPPHHINYFNFETLPNMLNNIGFQIMLLEATFPIDMFLLMGKNYVQDDSVGRDCHKMRKNFELNLSKAGQNELRRNLYQSFTKLNIGREIVVIGKKI